MYDESRYPHMENTWHSGEASWSGKCSETGLRRSALISAGYQKDVIVVAANTLAQPVIHFRRLFHSTVDHTESEPLDNNSSSFS